jgi:hypothetical protein
MNQSWILQVQLAFTAGMRPDTRTVPSLTRPPGPVIDLTCDSDDDETEVS